mgnify:CR=1 FL=1
MTSNQSLKMAPELKVSRWFNVANPISLESLRGKVVILGSFQMLCPGCVSYGLPQLQEIAAQFPWEKVAVVGLHTVFEHHAAMTPVSLDAFIHEYRLNFPIGVDTHGADDVPATMKAYAFKGTPSLAVIDKLGRLRASHYGRISDLLIGALIADLLAESMESLDLAKVAVVQDNGCSDDGCIMPS